jgi:UDP-N-acetyl-D-glucosamine/UDP-N-acetyl-D-galactosamine dehydrogenase
MRYLVTGCAGFIASKVCEMLLERGDEVVGIDSLNDAYDVRLKHWRLAQLLGQSPGASNDHRLNLNTRFPLMSENGRFSFIKGDTSNKDDVRRAFVSGKFDAVLNLAARAGVPTSFDDPVGFHRSNTEGVANILEAMAKHGVKIHVLASTSSVYATAPGIEAQRSKETDCTDYPRSPYAASKKAAELLCHSYAVRRDNPIHTTVVRYFTVYGPAGRPDMSIFRFIESNMRGTEIEVTGDGKQSRDFTYVDDVARGTILASKGCQGFRIINLGGGQSPTSINDVISLIEARCKKKLKRTKAAPAIGDMTVSMADISRAKAFLDWEPQISFAEGIRRTVAWHKHNRIFASTINLPGQTPILGKEIIGIIGLGYVGLPLAHSLSKHFKVVGFDRSTSRVKELRRSKDRTKEIGSTQLRAALAGNLTVTGKPADLRKCSMIIVTVPTPVDESKLPDLGPVKSAAETIGKELRHMRKGTIVVYESTVYPGCTEEDCVPIIEQSSGLKRGKDFHFGYSPERINPGDKAHTLDKITKVVAGDSEQTTAKMISVYAKISKDIHVAESIKVAEAAKVIENTQRDLNIALVNELVVIFERLGIKTSDVLRAAETKWNFLKFKPGLVGGHCIGVDPYYLTNRAQRAGYHPEIILAGRRLNDGMPKMFADYFVKRCINWGHSLAKQRVLVLGLTFKENIPDFRNSKSLDLVRELQTYGLKVDTFDPHVDVTTFKADPECHDVAVLPSAPKKLSSYVAIVLAVEHREFLDESWINKVFAAKKTGTKVFDLKNAWNENEGLADWTP